AEPRPLERRRPDGMFAGPLAHVPLQSRLAVTLGVVVGLFASIVLSEAGDVVSKAALWIGIGAGFVVAVILWIRARQGAP
ncbi:MAG: hypothetical protein QOF73_5435, partial [Thermomicrobiales bacterium]|nr:hypothetical protein [Thermomicrobiales bacterium]